MARRYVHCGVAPNPNVPAGMATVRLAVLSPRWRGPRLTLRFPPEKYYVLAGWSAVGGGAFCGLELFWTRREEGGPAVCLALGGDGGLKMALCGSGGEEPDWTRAVGYPLLALADRVIPEEVREAIGPPPPETPAPLLLS